MVYLMIDRLLKGEYKPGEPWKLPKAAGFLVPIIGKPPYGERGYILLSEAGDKVEFRDTGSISAVEARNRSGGNVFIRKGTMLQGKDTQSRSPVHSFIVEPSKLYTPITVNCIHASHGISTGSGFKAEGVAPQSVTQNLGEQGSTWASIDRYTSKLKRAYRASAPSPEAERLMDVAADNLVETEEAAKAAVDPVMEALSKIPGDLPDQIGVVVYDMRGVVAVELFDHPESWRAFSRSIIRSYGETLTEEASPLVELRTDRAEEILKDFLGKAKKTRMELITENSVSKIWRLADEDVEGEVAELHGSEIHFLLGRPNERRSEGMGVEVETQSLAAPPVDIDDLALPEEVKAEDFVQKKGGYSLLEQLARTPQRFSELVEERFVSRGTLSTRIKEAEELGLVEKGIRKINGTPAYTITETGEKVKKKTEEKAK